jgi:hypothetical protein
MNLPFYALAIRQLGWRFTIKSLIAVSLMSALADALPVFFTLGPCRLVGGDAVRRAGRRVCCALPARRDAGRGGDRGAVAAGRTGCRRGARS